MSPSAEQRGGNKQDHAHAEQIEIAIPSRGDLVYDNIEEKPELHFRTWIAVAAMFLLNFVQVFALQGPPSVLSHIGRSIDATKSQTWIPNSLSLVQAVLGPMISSASDVFQARKILLVSSCCISFIGSATAPSCRSIGRLVTAQALIGVGFASVPLTYCVPSEILPRRWRPVVQGAMNVASSLAAVCAPLSIGALTRADPEHGWRKFYWIQMALWGATAIGILLAYRPPQRHTSLDGLSLPAKILSLDLTGFALFTIGLTLLLIGISLGGGLYPWDSSRVVGTLIAGVVLCIAFGIYEWKGTRTGILHHDLFQGDNGRGRTFSLCVVLIMIEGILLFSYIIFYPVMTDSLFEQDAFLLVLRGEPFWIGCAVSTMAYGWISTRLRSIRTPMFVGYLLWTGAIIGLATVQPGQGVNATVLCGLAGFGCGAPLCLIIAGVQLSAPHSLIATATSVTTSGRAVAATVFTAVYSAAYTDRTTRLVPQYISAAALAAGLPASSVSALVTALSANNETALGDVADISEQIAAASSAAQKHALADSIRVVYMIAAPFGALACIICFFMGDLTKTMNYRVDAPVEELKAIHTVEG
ncbi:uncharacterized protein N0V89_009667 [Didymosphaeria variabile]|uniref:Major facilitator superfamily (MFS) profile domain-containing protein n=1 Tax=Didymosphaeria variabile TaxID=1932322 RepID=A0A9W8XE65_9PLEO|nr:uncharacterized protein N0V89_009667 [Didymosphaeria variabile]KAJ4348295.1 hypothetical protein N0V89_009667 [Didymosphaeria variabile]